MIKLPKKGSNKEKTEKLIQKFLEEDKIRMKKLLNYVQKLPENVKLKDLDHYIKNYC